MLKKLETLHEGETFLLISINKIKGVKSQDIEPYKALSPFKN